MIILIGFLGINLKKKQYISFYFLPVNLAERTGRRQVLAIGTVAPWVFLVNQNSKSCKNY